MPEVRRGITPPRYPCCLAEGAGCFGFFSAGVSSQPQGNHKQMRPLPPSCVSLTTHNLQQPLLSERRWWLIARCAATVATVIIRDGGGGLTTHILLCVLRRFDLADTIQGRPFDYVTKTGLVLVFSSQTKFLFFFTSPAAAAAAATSQVDWSPLQSPTTPPHMPTVLQAVLHCVSASVLEWFLWRFSSGGKIFSFCFGSSFFSLVWMNLCWCYNPLLPCLMVVAALNHMEPVWHQRVVFPLLWHKWLQNFEFRMKWSSVGTDWCFMRAVEITICQHCILQKMFCVSKSKIICLG